MRNLSPTNFWCREKWHKLITFDKCLMNSFNSSGASSEKVQKEENHRSLTWRCACFNELIILLEVFDRPSLINIFNTCWNKILRVICLFIKMSKYVNWVILYVIVIKKDFNFKIFLYLWEVNRRVSKPSSKFS